MEPRILRRRQVEKYAGIGSKATLYRLIQAGDFPKPIQLGVRAVGWRREEVDEWIASRPASANLNRGAGRHHRKKTRETVPENEPA